MIYNILNIDASAQSNTTVTNICKKMNVACTNFIDPMESLDYLMDHKINALVIHMNTEINKNIDFLRIIHNDYENTNTPIIIISDTQENVDLSFTTYKLNVVSILSPYQYNKELSMLLNNIHDNNTSPSLKKTIAPNKLDVLSREELKYGANFSLVMFSLN